MKQFIKILTILFVFIAVVGCEKNQVIKVCSLQSAGEDNRYTVDSKYEIYGSNGFVDKIVVTEIIESSDETVLENYQNTLKDRYEEYHEKYGTHDNTVTKKDNQIISKTVIDYKKLDMKKYTDDNPLFKEYAKGNKISFSGRIQMYEQYGLICE